MSEGWGVFVIKNGYRELLVHYEMDEKEKALLYVDRLNATAKEDVYVLAPHIGKGPWD